MQNDLIEKYKDFHLQLLNINIPNIYTNVFDEGKNLRHEELRFYNGLVTYAIDNYS